MLRVHQLRCSGRFYLPSSQQMSFSSLLGMPHLTYLRAFKTSHCHEDVVKVCAAPPQHIHSCFIPFLSQFVDGIFSAERVSVKWGKTIKRAEQLHPKPISKYTGE